MIKTPITVTLSHKYIAAKLCITTIRRVGGLPADAFKDRVRNLSA